MSLRSLRIGWRVVLLALLPTGALLVAVINHIADQRAVAAQAETELARIEAVEALARVQATNVFPELSDISVRLGPRSSLVADIVISSMWQLSTSRYAGADDQRSGPLADDPASPGEGFVLPPEVHDALERQRTSIQILVAAWDDGRTPTADQIREATQARQAADLALANVAHRSTSAAWVVSVATVDAVRSSWVEFAYLAPNLLGLDVATLDEMAVLSGQRRNATERVVTIIPTGTRARVEQLFASETYGEWLEAASAASRVAQGSAEPWSALDVARLTNDAVDLAVEIDAIAVESVEGFRSEVGAEARAARQSERRLLVFLAVLVTVTSVLTLAVLHSILDPIRLLTARAAAVAAGDLGGPANPIQGRDELARLESVLDDVAQGLRHLELQVAAIADGRLDDPRLGVPAPGAVGAHVQGRVEELRRASGALRVDAGTDPLTRLLNRRGLIDALRADQRSDEPRTVIYLDLDRFKAVNDRHGHRHGDAVLIEVAERLRSLVRPDDAVARVGGDEFALVVAGLDDAGIVALAERIEERVRQPVNVEGIEHRVGCSLGRADLAVGADPAAELDRAVDEADRRMLKAKATRRTEPASTEVV